MSRAIGDTQYTLYICFKAGMVGGWVVVVGAESKAPIVNADVTLEDIV